MPSNSNSPTSATSKTSERPPRSVRITTTIAGRQWNSLLATAEGATPFHRYEFLTALAEDSGTTFHPIVGLVDNRPVGVFPVFERSLGPVTTLGSPVPRYEVRYLGPLSCRPPQRESDAVRACRRRRDFLVAAISCVRSRFAPISVQFQTTPQFDVCGLFESCGYETAARHAHVVNLTAFPRGRDEVDGEYRSNPRAVQISEAGVDSVASIVDCLRTRHRDRGYDSRITAEFVTDLAERLPDGTVRPYVARRSSRILGGVITLDDGETVYRWLPGIPSETDQTVTERLDRHIANRAAERGRKRYDLMAVDHCPMARETSPVDRDVVTSQRLRRRSRSVAMLSNLVQWLR
ncbi:MAG: GNAT family N-acetyltransferase [Halorientalis sp.]